ncbi:MAG TPA: DUF1656 domain-containing protein [Rhodoblastus sp.]|nr:DUF1656 domain-containing protein [Rhodoblastus sp.]
MRFVEVNLFGVYVAPMAALLLVAWICTIALRMAADHFGLLRYVWHPALFIAAVYMVVLSSLVLFMAR